MQRVKKAAVSVEGRPKQEIGQGLAVLLGVGPEDRESDADYIAGKIAGLRIFSDANGKMNLSVKDIDSGAILLVSQFTLYGDARRGMRPSFIGAALPDPANRLYERVAQTLREKYGLETKTGVFGADMLVEISNDGPVTILLDSSKLF